MVFDRWQKEFFENGAAALAMACALLAAGHAHSEESNAFRGEVAGTQICIFEVGVAGIDDEIALSEVRQQIGDHGIHGRPGGNQQHYCAGLAEQASELLNTFRAANIAFL